MYKAVPEDAQRPLHILARGAQYPRSVEDAKALVVKPVEVQDVGHCMRWGRWVARNFRDADQNEKCPQKWNF
jgi:hypothetical protein